MKSLRPYDGKRLTEAELNKLMCEPPSVAGTALRFAGGTAFWSVVGWALGNTKKGAMFGAALGVVGVGVRYGAYKVACAEAKKQVV